MSREVKTIVVLGILVLVISIIVVFAIVKPRLLVAKKELIRTRNELLHLYEEFARLQQYADKAGTTGNRVIDSRYSAARIQKRIKELEKQI